ncbi:MAG TPA: hypothetical protein PL157_14015, partial [Acidobacteriota bacterium]|nr:hypothetical protein [Acidobacteriota bacterium]
KIIPVLASAATQVGEFDQKLSFPNPVMHVIAMEGKEEYWFNASRSCFRNTPSFATILRYIQFVDVPGLHVSV